MKKEIIKLCEEVVKENGDLNSVLEYLGCNGIVCNDKCPFSSRSNNNIYCEGDTDENYLKIAKKYLADNSEVKEFTKADLKDGMVIKYKNSNSGYMIFEDKSIAINGYMSLGRLNDNLLSLTNSEWDVESVYKFKGGFGFGLLGLRGLLDINNSLSLGYLELIWEREEKKKEINWDKVPKWTKIQVRDYKGEKWFNAYFLEYKDEEGKWEYYVSRADEFTYTDYCRVCYKCCRIHESVDIPKEWYK